jgi:RHS repeat-associated protein
VWLPGRSQPAGDGPNLGYHYLIRTDGPSAVSTDTLRANGNYLTSYALYDGFLRSRQTQSPAEGGGRVITDSVYDSRGLLAKQDGQLYADGAPASALLAAGDNNVPSQTLTVYDGAGRPTASIFRALGVERWRSSTAYLGDHTDTTPPPGGTATSVYLDARGRTTALSQYHGATPAGAADVTRYGYATNGQLATVIDPAGNQWRYGYDLGGHRTSVHDPDRGDSSSTYDAAGQLLTATDSRSSTLAFVYDALGRRTEEHDGSAGGTPLATWTYDTLLKGLLTSSTRFDGGSAYTTAVVGYDGANRPTGVKVTIPSAERGVAGNYETDLTYRPDGSAASVTLPRAGDLAQETLTFGYDDLGLPKTLGGAATYVNDTSYTRFGELAQLSMGAGGARVWDTRYYEDDTRRLARSIVEREQTAGSTVDDFRYQYDPAGNATQIADVPDGGPADTQCFGYDSLRRMTSAWTTAGGCAPAPSASAVGGATPYWTTFGYDVTGNRTSETQHGLGGAADTARTYRYTSPGQPQPHAVSSVTTAGPGGSRQDSFGYDATGNTTSRSLAGSTQTLSWDSAGRLSSSRAAAGTTTSFAYDADGGRLLRRDPNGTTLYLGAQEIRWNSAGNTRTGTRFYSYGSGVIAVRTGAGLRWQAGDYHGTATTSIGAAALDVTRRLFTPFGDTRGAAPAAWPDEHAFVGGTRDDTLGLLRLGAREYDPATGRFMSVDPIVDPGDPQQLNGYAYAGNSPATMSDPDGLKYFVDVEGMVTLPDLAHATPAQIDRAQTKSAFVTRINAQAKARYDAALAATGHTQKEVDEARRLQQKSVIDVVLEAGGDILRKLLGIDDIKGCFGQGDLGSCISVAMMVIPWDKLLEVGELIGAIKRAWAAVTDFLAKREWANKLLGAVSKAAEKEEVKVAPPTPGGSATRESTGAELGEDPAKTIDRDEHKNVSNTVKGMEEGGIKEVTPGVSVPTGEGPGAGAPMHAHGVPDPVASATLAVGAAAAGVKYLFRRMFGGR